MRRALVLGVAAALSLGVAGSPASGDVQEAAVTKRILAADPGGALAFTKKRLRAPRGRIVLVMRNPESSGLPHGIGIKRRRGASVAPGGTSRVRIRLRPGRYTYYCPVAGHRAAGMKGRLIVRRR